MDVAMIPEKALKLKVAWSLLTSLFLLWFLVNQSKAGHWSNIKVPMNYVPQECFSSCSDSKFNFSMLFPPSSHSLH